MASILIPTLGSTDWRSLLGDPGKHWKRGKSAFECAVSWESAKQNPRGLPDQVAAMLDACELTNGGALLLGIPEHQVVIEGGGHPSQNDLWALLRTPKATISMAVEAKSGEPFDKYVAEWIRDASSQSGKPKRLASLKKVLGIGEANLEGIRYQLMHRTASPLLEATRFHASAAVLLIQSFGGEKDDSSYKDYCRFCELMECESARNTLCLSNRKTDVPLLIGWLDCLPASDMQVAESVGG
ncbi:MAG: hypothetical protein KIS63_00320 [Caldilineales bacterium]|nr:hypothetical protein [Planctomycetales bacterium]MCW5856701.1 hypothetical protein [Caldilineales bacterium]